MLEAIQRAADLLEEVGWAIPPGRASLVVAVEQHSDGSVRHRRYLDKECRLKPMCSPIGGLTRV
jgi:hypothetical protein